MDELCAELDRCAHTRQAARPAAPADAVASLEHEDPPAGVGKARRGREPRGAGADDNDLVRQSQRFLARISIGTTLRSARARDVFAIAWGAISP